MKKKFVAGIVVLIAFSLYAGNSLLAAHKVQNAAQSTSAAGTADGVSVFFPRAGQNVEGQIVYEIGTAKKTLDVAIYSFTDTKIAGAIVAAKKRGVNVRLISDRESSNNSSQRQTMLIIKSAGIPIKINSHSGIMHLKVLVIDNNVATTGSFNYTKSAQNLNDENFVVLNNSKIAQTYESEFQNMWNDNSNFQEW